MRTDRIAGTGMVLAAAVAFLVSCGGIDSDMALTSAIESIPQRRAGLAVLLGMQHTADPVYLHDQLGYVVQGFDPDSAVVGRARAAVARNDVYGPVAVSAVTALAELPLADNSANLLVVDKFDQRAAAGLAFAELVRATAPYGHIVVAGAAAGVVTDSADVEAVSVPGLAADARCFRKRYPSSMDEWPQFRHDAALSSVSHDALIGPATGVQWIDGLLWTGGARRTVMILSGGGRAYYLFAPWHYEAPIDTMWLGFHVEARDAFNGLLLWQRRVADATELERPMAVDGNTLYTHAGDPRKVVALDGATGAVLRQFDVAGDIAVHAGKLVVAVERGTWAVMDPATGARERTIASGETGETPERARLFASSFNYPAILLDSNSEFTLARNGDTRLIRKADFATGAVAWETPRREHEVLHTVQGDRLFTLEILDDAADQGGFLHAYDATSGAHLWQYTYMRKKAGTGFYVAAFKWGDTVWTYDNVPQGPGGRYAASDKLAVRDPEDPKKVMKNRGYVALDATSGKLLTNDLGVWKDFGRCGPDLATPHYILGMDYNIYARLDDGTGLTKVAGNFARGDCGFSYCPANGLRYNSDNSCACEPYVQGMLAVASDSLPDLEQRWNTLAPRLRKGPAFGFAGVDSREDWPIYRANALRTAVSAAPVPSAPKVAWKSVVGGKITAPVVGGGSVFVAQTEAHAVHAFSAAGGRHLWSYRAGGRIDSPPTYHRGIVLAGSSDGRVQALRADNGALVWEFLAAPIDRRIMVRGQLESLWPVFGTVLVDSGAAYVIAGRHGDADGGMFLYALNPLSGEELWRQRLSAYADIRSDPREHDIYKSRFSGYKAYNMRNDLTSTDGRTLFFSTAGVDLAKRAVLSQTPGRCLVTGQGTFLADNTYPNPAVPGRFHWSVVGTDTANSWRTMRGGQQYPDAALVAFTGDTLYGIRQSQYLHRWKDWNDRREGYLFAASFSQLADTAVEKVPFWAVKHHLYWTATEKDNNPRFKALAVGSTGIVVACQPGGGLLGGHEKDTGDVLVFDRAGAVVSRVDIGAEPLFDGVALAGGCVFVSTQRGGIVCLN